MGTLQMSFHGPFLYRFTKSGVEIYAPKCPGHTAGLFTAKNELPLTGRHRLGHSKCYRITGPVFTPPNPLPASQFYDPDNTILDATKSARPAFHKSHFCLIVPLPQIVIPMIPNDVEVIDNSTNPPGTPTGKLARRATALRFYYNADLSKNLLLTLDNSAAPTWVADFDAPTLGHDFADVEVRYTSQNGEIEEHQDALECFDQIASLTGVDWWLCYDRPTRPHGPQAFVKAGNDCRAPILTIR